MVKALGNHHGFGHSVGGEGKVEQLQKSQGIHKGASVKTGYLTWAKDKKWKRETSNWMGVAASDFVPMKTKKLMHPFVIKST